MNDKTISILYLYSRDMNIYGDWGNVLTLQRRLQWHGYQADIIQYNQADPFPKGVDIIVGGGGQDAHQDKVKDDLHAIGPQLRELAEDDTPILLVCGLYQLFGNTFTTSDGHTIKGIGILDIETHAGPKRLVGNIVTRSQEFGDIVGYENHSGQTFLGAHLQPLGEVLKGAGNNGQDKTEGARYHNVIGTYLHGSLLPKNPVIADHLIEKAVTKKYGDFKPSVIDDRFADRAREISSKRPR
jgi:CobQ-like glutamine amidotransferase family enzyme